MEIVAKMLGCELSFRHSYIHISNGKIEQAINVVSRQLHKLCHDHPDKWFQFLPSIQNTHNISASLVHGFSPHYIMYGREYRDHFQTIFDIQSEIPYHMTLQDIVSHIHKTRDLTIQTITDTHRQYALQMAETYDRHSRPFQFQLLQPVYLKVLSFKQGTSGTLLPRFTGQF